MSECYELVTHCHLNHTPALSTIPAIFAVFLSQPVAFSLPSSPPHTQALMMLPSHISQSEEVLKFFETKPDDLNPPTEWVTMTAHFKDHTLLRRISFISLHELFGTKHCPLACCVCCVVQQLGQHWPVLIQRLCCVSGMNNGCRLKGTVFSINNGFWKVWHPIP